tara:strand:- start:497 stop:703 length:207 start_codon:yes stop_codon:yes gene_type:complete
MSDFNEFQKIINMLEDASDMPDGSEKREAVMKAAQNLMKNFIGFNDSAGISTKHSLEQLNDPFVNPTL